MQYDPNLKKTFPLQEGRHHLLMVPRNHLTLNPGQGESIQSIVQGCGPVSNPFNVSGFSDPPEAMVSAVLFGEQPIIGDPPPPIVGQPSPQPATGYSFAFDNVPAGTYTLVIQGSDPPEECEITVT